MISDLSVVEGLGAQSNGEHSHLSLELKVVKAFLEGLVLINDVDVRDLVQLINLLDSVLDQLSKLHGAFHSIGNSLNDY